MPAPDTPKRATAWAVLALIPLLAHAPLPLLGLSADPLYFVSALTLARPDGILPGLPGWNDPNTGFTVQALGGLAARDWLHGVVPWWNPYSGIGLPLAAEMQPAAFFLPFSLLLALPGGVLALKIALQMLAGWSAYPLFLHLGLARRIALTGAILWQLNGTFAWFGDGPMHPIAFLPLLLLGVERSLAFAGDGRRGGWAWVAVAIAYSLLSGFPETAYLDGLLALAWAGWRLATAPPAARLPGALKLAAGGVAGLLMSAPATVPFLQYLATAAAGAHAAAGMQAVPATTWGLLLVPYLYGPIDYDAQIAQWGQAGGCVTLPLLLLAILGLRGRGPVRGLRWLLGAWTLVCVAKMAQVPGVAELVNLIPLLSRTWFFRYAVPSWSFAVLVLACFAGDDWLRGRRLAPWPAGAVCAAALGAAMLLARPMLSTLLRDQPDFPIFLAGSLTFAGLTLAGAALLVRGRASPARATALGGGLAGSALLLFAFPLLSGTRPLPLDLGVVAFLRDHLGLSRFYTLAPLQPNYGAWFAVAAINDNYLPVPLRWAAFVPARLDPSSSGLLFTGFGLTPDWTGSQHAAALARRMAAYEALGVRYVLAPVRYDPFLEPASPPRPAQRPAAQFLAAGETVSGDVAGDAVRPGRLAAFAVTIASFAGTADGALTLRLCTPRACAGGSAPVAGADDNAPFAIPLDAPLEVTAGESLHYELARANGTAPLAVYRWRYAAGAAPEVAVTYTAVRRVFRGAVADIYELPAPAPYFEAPACVLSPFGRERLSATCDRPGTLLRRELYDAGWRARVNGAPVSVDAAGAIFQSVALPAGRSAVRFTYRPPSAGWACAACAVGLAGLAGGLLREAARMRRGGGSAKVGL